MSPLIPAVRRARAFAAGALTRLRVAATGSAAVPGMLSFVVPVYNVERYLDECLASLRSQDWRNAEIVVVDDGTPDDSIGIARRHRLRDPRIRIVRRENGGLSAARNTGVAAARGEFIAFVDSDDTVPPAGYAMAVSTLQRTGSDFAVLPYQRLRGGEIHRPPIWIRRAHQETRLRTTVTEFPFVQVNQIACSKVYRRDFWNGIGLRFEEGIIYEDQQVAAEAYTRASRIDVLTEPVYNWRSRDDLSSISQNKRTVDGLRAQFAAANASIRILHTHGTIEVLHERVRQLLSNDLPQFVTRAPEAEPGYWELIEQELPLLAAELGPAAYSRLVRAQHKVLYHLVTTGQRDAAARFLEAGGLKGRDFPVGEEEVGPVAYLPGWRGADPVRGEVPDEAFLLSEDQLRDRLEAVTEELP